jgi:hypothetical protein
MRSLFASFALASTFVCSPGSAQIFQPGTQPLGSGHADALMTSIQTPGGCTRCHGGYADDGDYEPSDSWRGSMMANAERDMVARAALAIAEQDLPGAADFCVRCHTPFTWYNGGSSRPEYDPATMQHRFAPDDASGLSPDLDGVVCMSCHRSVDPGDTQISNTQLVLNEGQVRFGPYEYTDGTDPRHETAFSEFLSQGRFCGQCHDIHNPLLDGHIVDDTGRAVPTGRRFVIERTYSEWAYSRFAEPGADARTCQDCHMPEVDRPVLAAAELDVLRPEMSRHDLAGGSVWQPLAIVAALPAPFSTDLAPLYEASSARARRMLESAASLEVVSSALAGATATATIRVTNETGHKLPTGYPEGRRMWLEVDVVDSSDRVVASSAHYDEDTDTLGADPQARVYDVKLGERQPDGMVRESFHFALNDTTIHDTRIPPAGFDAPADLDITPSGRDYANGDGSFRHWDEPSYSFASLCGTGTLRLRARLRYQANSREYMEFLRDQAPASPDPALGGRSWGDVAYEAWRTHGGDQPIDMETVEVELGASPGACPEPDAAVLEDAAAVPDAGASTDDAGSATPDAGGGTSGGGCGCRAGRGGDPRGLVLAALVAVSALLARRRRDAATRLRLRRP